jgi:hypothetical protein
MTWTSFVHQFQEQLPLDGITNASGSVQIHPIAITLMWNFRTTFTSNFHMLNLVLSDGHNFVCVIHDNICRHQTVDN